MEVNFIEKLTSVADEGVRKKKTWGGWPDWGDGER